jgi:hypothetical protein
VTARTHRKTILSGPFSLKGVDRMLPPAVTDEELIEGLSFPVYRRVSMMILLPVRSHLASSLDLQAAQDRDAQMPAPTATRRSL